MTTRTKPPFRADHVGSLLRPQALLDERARWKAGEITGEELRARENEHIAAVVRLQEATGIGSVTDGEYRRENFHRDFIDRIEGVEFKPMMPPGSEGESIAPAKAPFVALVHDRMKRPAGGIEVENYKYAASLTENPVKVAIPSPTMTHFRGGREAISREAYPDIEGFFADLAAV